MPWWVILLIVCGVGCAAVPILAIVAAIAIPSLLRSRLAANQSGAIAGLKQLASYEEVWRTTDADRNDAPDYWTRDVAGFHCVRDAAGNPIAFIDLGLARADASPGAAYPELGGRKAVPKQGYLYKVLAADPEGKPYIDPSLAPPRAEGAPEGPCTHATRFAFCAYPGVYQSDGIFTFLVSEEGVVWKKDLGRGGGVDAWPRTEAEGAGWTPVD
jgi:hypothetical protein